MNFVRANLIFKKAAAVINSTIWSVSYLLLLHGKDIVTPDTIFSYQFQENVIRREEKEVNECTVPVDKCMFGTDLIKAGKNSDTEKRSI